MALIYRIDPPADPCCYEVQRGARDRLLIFNVEQYNVRTDITVATCFWNTLSPLGRLICSEVHESHIRLEST